MILLATSRPHQKTSAEKDSLHIQSKKEKRENSDFQFPILQISAMEISEKLLHFKYPILISFASCFFAISLIYLAPSFIDIVKYFWPLFMSTAMFLVAVVVFGRISPLPDSPGEKAGEGLLDFVAGDAVGSSLEEAESEEQTQLCVASSD